MGERFATEKGRGQTVKEFEALLITSLDELEIEAKAKDLPDTISVDVSSLLEIGDHILVKDLVIPGEVTILDDPEETTNVADKFPAEVSRLTPYVENLPEFKRGESQENLPPHLIELLKSLGYIR